MEYKNGKAIARCSCRRKEIGTHTFVGNRVFLCKKCWLKKGNTLPISDGSMLQVLDFEKVLIDEVRTGGGKRQDLLFIKPVVMFLSDKKIKNSDSGVRIII